MNTCTQHPNVVVTYEADDCPLCILVKQMAAMRKENHFLTKENERLEHESQSDHADGTPDRGKGKRL